MHFWGLSDSIVSEPKTCYFHMLGIAVIIVEISHEEVRHDFLLYKAENHTIIVVTPASEEGTKTFRPQFASGSNIVRIKPSTFIVPLFNYEVKPFTPRNTWNIFKNNLKTKTRCMSCSVSALEQILASLIRKPPKIIRISQRSKKANPPVNDMAGFFYVKF